MLERESEYFSQYAIDPNLDDYFDGFELPEFGNKKDGDTETDFDDIFLDDMDGDLWDEN